MKTNRKEMILQTINDFGVVSVKQLHEILNLGSYRYTCKLIQELEDYLIVERTKQKKIYLNKRGKEFIGSTTEIAAENDYYFENQIYLFFKKPPTWQKNVEIQVQSKYEGIEVKGLNVIQHLNITVPAVFQKGAYLCLVEVDGNRTIQENEERINLYRKVLPHLKQEKYMLFYFTKTEGRKKRLEEMLEGIVSEVFVLNE